MKKNWTLAAVLILVVISVLEVSGSGFFNLGAFWKRSNGNPFNITGVHGTLDVTPDEWYANVDKDRLNINWTDAPAEVTYDATIYEADGSTVYCNTINLPQNTVTFEWAIAIDCTSAIVEGDDYVVVITAKAGQDIDAMNAPFTFTVDTVPPAITIASGPTQPETDQDDAAFTFSATDATSGVATYECYLDNVLQGSCTSPKSFTGLADGDHEFKLIVTDNAGNSDEEIYAWNINTLTITGPDQFYTTVGAAWSNVFTVAGGTGAANITYTLPVMPATATVTGDATYAPNVEYTSVAAVRYEFTLRATDSVSGNTKDFEFVVDSFEADVCVWVGVTDTTWTTVTNWVNCAGAAPLTTSKIAIYEDAPNMPIVAANTTVDSFGLGPGGGTVTINSGRSLGITAATNSIRSSVRIRGNTSTCTNCLISPTASLAVTDSAVLTLSTGIAISLQNGALVTIGDGTTGGHLKTEAAGLSTEWPAIAVCSASASGVLRLNGATTEKSTLELDGIGIRNTCGSANNTVTFNDWYEILKFDNVKIFPPSTPTGGASLVRFVSCTNATITDVTWDSITLSPTIASGSFNINASGTNCNTLPTITVSPSSSPGFGYGEIFENDPNAKIDWSNSGSFTCTWTGNTNTDWHTATNWDNCANARFGYPDQLDYVIVPVTVNQPIITNSATIRGFAPGIGGGTITINSARSLYLTAPTNNIRSDVILQGNTSTCTNCTLTTSANVQITDGAKLTLLRGVHIYHDSGFVFVGNGVTAGHLATGPAGATNEWPSIRSGHPTANGLLQVNGHAGENSTIDIDGARISTAFGSANNTVSFHNYYEVEKFDNITIDSPTPTGGSGLIRFVNCTNAIITDTGWDSMLLAPFIMNGGANIKADGTNCSTLPTITISRSPSGGLAYGEPYENDPNAKIDWTNGASFNCTWTGATDNSWFTPTNWDNCNNLRGGYPDQIDYAIIPITATQPTISATVAIRGFAVGTGGGTITINAGTGLLLGNSTQTIRSDVKIRGATSTCGNCSIASAGAIKITDGAKLTLMNGTIVGLNGNAIYAGDASTAGHFETDPATLATERPRLSTCNPGTGGMLIASGHSSAKSKIKIDALNISNSCGPTSNPIVFSDWYEIEKFDNITFDSAAPTGGNGSVRFTSCTNGTVTDRTWNALTFTTALAAGTYNVRAEGTNCSTLPIINLTNFAGAGAVEARENDPNNKIMWGAPSITGDELYYAQVATLWTETFTATGGSGSYTYSLPTAPAGATVDGSGVVEWTPATEGPFQFTIRVTDTVTSQFNEHYFQVDALAADTCLWTGGTSTTWETTTNWTFCGGVAPLTTSKVVISADAPNMPIIANSLTIHSFGLGTGGGNVTINTGRVLTLSSSTNSIRSSVAFTGSTTTCGTCDVYSAGNIEITDDATVTLYSGARLRATSTLLVGKATSPGHLVTRGGVAQNTWPIIGVGFCGSGTRMHVQGTATDKSSIDIDGLYIGCFHQSYGLDFLGNVEIKKFDRLYLYTNGTGSGMNYMRFSSCAGSNVLDVAWDDYYFAEPTGPGFNIKADGTDCNLLPAITVAHRSGTNGGPGYGSISEIDPHSKINWLNSDSVVCTWNGSISNAWTNPSNWTNCNNARGNYPDQMDTVIIPVTATQPLVSALTSIRGFAPGVGGGTITIAAGQSLRVGSTTQTFQSDVRIIGATPTCTTCYLGTISGNMTIVNDATLDVGSGIVMSSNWSGGILKVGDGVTGGRFRTSGGSVSAERPVLGSTFCGTGLRVEVRGAAGSPAKLDINGLRFGCIASDHVRFYGHWEIERMDNLLTYMMPAYNMGAGNAYIRFHECTNGAVSDLTWENTVFNDPVSTGSYNIRADGTDCNSISPFTVSHPAGHHGGPAYGEDYDLDPNNIVGWSNSSSFSCEWTGATNTSWSDSTNWINCGNGRGGYPDHLDTAIIPSAPLNQPTVSASQGLKGFSAAAGGGIVTLNANVNFYLTGAIESSVTLKGNTDNCTTCRVFSIYTIDVINDATLTLLKGIDFHVGKLNIGNGVTRGSLTTSGGANSLEWPIIGIWMNNGCGWGTNVDFTGAGASYSRANIDGLRVRCTSPTNFKFVDRYQIDKFDKIQFDAYTNANNIEFADCTNATINDNKWESHAFNVAGTGKNVIASHASCATLPIINLTGSTGVRAGEAYDTDPFDRIVWDAPSALSLAHTIRNRTFTVSWTAGTGHGGAGGCKLQYYKDGTTWTDLANTYDCDANANNEAAEFPASDGWTNNFNTTGVTVRLVRISDSAVLGEFTQKPVCGGGTAPSATSTPDIDEDCDSNWDDFGAHSFTFEQGNPTGTGEPTTPYTCPTTADYNGYTNVPFTDVLFKAEAEYHSEGTCSTYITNTWLEKYEYSDSGNWPTEDDTCNHELNQGCIGTKPACVVSGDYTVVQGGNWNTGNSYCRYFFNGNAYR